MYKMSVTVNIPYAAALSCDGSGNLRVLESNTFQWGSYADASFNDVQLSMSVSAIKDLFMVSNVSDEMADMTVDISGNASGNFILALFNSLTGVAKKSDDATMDVETYLVSEAQAQIDAALATDGIAAGLEAENVHNLGITDFADDASNAAVAMYNGLAPNSAANLRKIIALQYQNAEWLPAGGDSADEPAQIPFKAGDVINFRFIANQTYMIHEVIGTEDNTTSPADGSVTHLGSIDSTPLSGYTIAQKIINVAITLKEDE
jgi:hypothetical protein